MIETDKEHIAVAMEFYVEHDGVLYVPDVPRSEALEPASVFCSEYVRCS